MSSGRKCPHAADIRFCPLYVAAHIAGAGGCDDAMMDTGRCAVDRGRRSYAAGVERLRVKVPGLVEQLEWKAEQERAKAQRARNLRLNGIH